jgi:hypothetical protein
MSRRLWSAGLVVTLVSGAMVALAGPAFAGGGMNVTGVAVGTGLDLTVEKSKTAYCPSGTRVLGGGAWTGGNPDVHITGMMPDALANSFTAYARWHGPEEGAWYLSVEASCAPEPPGLIYVADFTGGDSASTHSLYAWCPPGRVVLGVGARVTAADTSKVFLTYVKPTGTGNGAETGGVETKGGYAGNWWLHSWAICATEPAGWDIVAAPNAAGEATAMAWCPLPGKLTGGGAYISLSLGQVYLTKIRIDYVGTPAGSVPAGTFSQANWLSHATGPTGHDWYLKSYGICVA